MKQLKFGILGLSAVLIGTIYFFTGFMSGGQWGHKAEVHRDASLPITASDLEATAVVTAETAEPLTVSGETQTAAVPLPQIETRTKAGLIDIAAELSRLDQEREREQLEARKTETAQNASVATPTARPEETQNLTDLNSGVFRKNTLKAEEVEQKINAQVARALKDGALAKNQVPKFRKYLLHMAYDEALAQQDLIDEPVDGVLFADEASLQEQ